MSQFPILCMVKIYALTKLYSEPHVLIHTGFKLLGVSPNNMNAYCIALRVWSRWGSWLTNALIPPQGC